MGIWNVTPDSFSSFCEEGDAASLAHGEKILAQGAEILDIGAESTRPRGTAIDDDEEQMRLRAPLSWAAGRQVPISLDTRHIATMKWAIDGDFIDIVNDVALSNRVTTQRDGAVFDIIRDSRCGYIAMAYEPHDAPELDFATCIRRITNWPIGSPWHGRRDAICDKSSSILESVLAKVCRMIFASLPNR